MSYVISRNFPDGGIRDISPYTTVRTSQAGGACTNHLVQTPAGVLYLVFVDANSRLLFKKSSDNGITWTKPTTINSASITSISVWYDRWSGISAGLIHIAYTDQTSDDTLYRTIDTENSDALSTETIIFAGASYAAGGHLSITRARGGNVLCKTVIDAGVEGGFYRLLNADVPNGSWASRTVDETIASQDQMILLPGFAADDQDILAIFYDASATELSRKLYDDSADTWSETSISTGITLGQAATAYPNFYATCDLANSQHILCAWNGVDTANADLKCWTITESAITAKTDVVANGTDDQGLCAIGIDTATGYWYAWYAGKSDGSETWTTNLNVYMKVSQDGGTTWGAETKISNQASANIINWMMATPRFSTNWAVCWIHDHATLLDDLWITAPMTLGI